MTGPPSIPPACGGGEETAPHASEAQATAAALAAATARFVFSATPRLDAELLLAHALGIDRAALLLDPDRAVPTIFASFVERRAAHEPVAYITGTRGFWSIDVAVGPGALVPRADSETLIDAAIAHAGATPPRRILDLGTGPGTLLLAALAEWPGATGLGIDSSIDALAYAARNAATLGLSDRARFAHGDWAAEIDERFDLVLANPPYIATGDALPAEVRDHEPAAALFAGADGLEAYRVLAPQLARLLSPGGAAILEIGHDQATAVAALLAAQGLGCSVRRDLGGRDRCLVVTP